MRFLVAMIFLVTLGGCNTPGCLIEDAVAVNGANFIANTLECSNLSGIKEDLVNVVSAMAPNLCKKAPQGVIANALCPIIASAVVDFVALNGIPAKWNCKATTASALVKDKLAMVCRQLPI